MTTDIPRISVGMPVFNGEPYVTAAIDSLLNQSLSDFELIICDNNSTDRTEQICRDYAARDRRIRYFRNEQNLGAARNYNKVFSYAQAPFFRWANADDLSAPELHAKCLSVLEQFPDAVLSYGKTRIIDKNGIAIVDYDDNLDLREPRPSQRFIRLSRSVGLTNIIYGLMRTDAVKKTSLFGNYVASDVNFMAELCLYGIFIEIPEYLFFRRMHPRASSWDRNNEETQRSFWDPKKKTLLMQRWRNHYEYFAAIHRAPLQHRETFRLYWFCFHHLFWEKQLLLRELKAWLQYTWSHAHKSKPSQNRKKD